MGSNQSERASRVIGWLRYFQEKLRFSSRTLPQLASGKRSAVYLEIPFEQAGLMREVLRIACREASQCADPRHFNGTGALQDAVNRLHECIDQQLRQKEVPE